jgi:hypothetical protein
MKVFKNIKAQSTIEFTFALIVMLFLIYGMVMVFRWAGMDLANRRWSQDHQITADVIQNAENPFGDPVTQLNFDGDVALPMAAVYHGNISNGNASQ